MLLIQISYRKFVYVIVNPDRRIKSNERAYVELSSFTNKRI